MTSRDELYSALDVFLAALGARDPSRVNWTPDVFNTENNVRLEPGDGLWNTVTARGPYDLRFADEQAGQVALFTCVEETNAVSPACFRLGVKDGAVCEVETVVARNADEGLKFSPQTFEPKPAMEAVVPTEERSSYEELIAIADGYFETIERNDGTIRTRFHPDCNRVENGLRTTNNPDFVVPVARLGCELYLGDSRYNLDELVEHGAPPERGAVLAPLHRVGHLLDAEADLGLLDRLCDGTRNLLMVGRVAPNKGHPDLIDALAALVDGWGDPARLLIVGKSDPGLAAYDAAIRERIARHRLEDHVCWLESVGEAQLKAAYLASQAFVTLSRHEGFCVPLIEAMALGVPVVAHASSAIPETIGEGGIVWNSTDPWLYAASLARLAADARFRNGLRDAARARYDREYAPAVLHERFLSLLEAAL